MRTQILALPAPSAARTRERNKLAKIRANDSALLEFHISNAAEGARPWIVIAKWKRWEDGADVETSSICVANSAKEAKTRHIDAAHKSLKPAEYEFKSAYAFIPGRRKS